MNRKMASKKTETKTGECKLGKQIMKKSRKAVGYALHANEIKN